jgi:hypothetical protein
MPPIRSLVFKHLAHRFKLVVVILLLSKIMLTYYCYTKGLVYITIAALSSYQPFSCSKCTKLNIHLSCNICSMFNAKYIYLTTHLYTY